jgi:cytochrome c2
MYRPLSALLLFLIVSCTQKQVLQTTLTPGNLALQIFQVNPMRDTLITGTRGGKIMIPAGAFKVPAGQTVTLFIKEAYSARDILVAGLTTEADGKPLRSGGMIFINAESNNQQVTVAKPITVSIPTDNYQDALQLYKGELATDSSLNWTNPIPLDTFSAARGKSLFTANCANCHNPYRDATGPTLLGCLEREPYPGWGYKFTNGALLTEKNDPYLNELKRKWNNTVMTVFKLSRQDYNDIITYVYSINGRTMPGPVNEPEKEAKPGAAIAPCDTVTALVETLYDTIYTSTDNYTLPAAETTFPQTENQPQEKPGRQKAADLEGLRKGFTDFGAGSGLYTFEIETLGWFNVDAEVEGYKGTIIVKLNGEIKVDQKMTVNLYLFCPRRKMLSVGTVHNDYQYSFEKIGGGIPLFKNDLCILLAFGSYKSQLYTGSVPFSVKEDREADIIMRPVDKALFYDLLLANNINGVDIRCKEQVEKVIPRPASIPCNQQNKNATDSAK